MTEIHSFWKKKIKAYIGFFIVQSFIIFGLLHSYIFYNAVRYYNIYMIGYLILLYLYTLFAKKNSIFIQFIRWFELENLFVDTQIIQEEVIPEKNCLLCFHPHGVMAYGILLNLNRKNTIFERLVALGSRVSLYCPFIGIILSWWGVQSVSPSNLKKLLRQGVNCAIYPGGFEEATLSTSKEIRLYLKSRKGFIKYGLQNGSAVFPVITYGENELFECLDYFTKFRLYLNKFKMVGTVFYSKYLALPNPNVKLITVIGNKLQLPTIIQPSNEQIDQYHKKYIEQIIKLHDKHQPMLQNKEMKLKIF